MSISNLTDIKDRLYQIRSAINASRTSADRAVRIMAVTKTRSYEDIVAALEAGVDCIGENRVQEAWERIPFPWQAAQELRFIGHLQKNKVKKVVGFFSSIDSVDSPELLDIIDKEANKRELIQDFLIEFNPEGEDTKSGLRLESEVETLVEHSLTLSACRFRGLMTIAPLGLSEYEFRKCFARVKTLYEHLKQQYNEAHIDTLSMGMSNDYIPAVKEGANLIRIGTALFGTRF